MSSDAVARGLPGGGGSPASFSLTTLAFREVAAIMKLDGFRAPANYDIADRVDTAADREFEQAARSVNSVKGSPQQSAHIQRQRGI